MLEGRKGTIAFFNSTKTNDGQTTIIKIFHNEKVIKDSIPRQLKSFGQAKIP